VKRCIGVSSLLTARLLVLGLFKEKAAIEVGAIKLQEPLDNSHGLHLCDLVQLRLPTVE